MLTMRFDEIRSVLCLGSHSDDIEIGCGGTLLRLLAENPGIDVRWVVLSGEGQRADEAVKSADRFLEDAGSKRVEVMHFRDSYFPYTGAEIKDAMHALAREVSPDLIFTHHQHDMHQDHRLVAELTRNAFRDHVILEYEIPKYDGDLGRPGVFAPLDEAVCTKKVQTIVDSFQSQSGKHWFSADTFWSMLRVRGLECNSTSGFAEAFHCQKLTI